MATPFVSVALAGVAANGNLTQIYPDSCTPGTGVVSMGNLVRKPVYGTIHGIQVFTDGVNGGVIEIWDLDGNDGAADVNTGVTITNAQLLAAIALGKARLMWTQRYIGGGTATFPSEIPVPFQHGIAARNVAAAGSCQINVTMAGGYVKHPISG